MTGCTWVSVTRMMPSSQLQVDERDTSTFGCPAYHFPLFTPRKGFLLTPNRCHGWVRQCHAKTPK